MLHISIHKNYILLAVFGIIILLLFLVFALPLLTDIQKDSYQLAAEKSDGEALRLQSDQIETFKKQYESYKPNLEKMNQVFIDPQNPVNFIEFLESTAAASSIKPKISLVQNSEDTSNTIVTFELVATDDFLKILDFLKKVENGPYLVEIKNMSIKNADLDPTAKSYPSGKVEVSFSINAFAKP